MSCAILSVCAVRIITRAKFMVWPSQVCPGSVFVKISVFLLCGAGVSITWLAPRFKQLCVSRVDDTETSYASVTMPYRTAESPI